MKNGDLSKLIEASIKSAQIIDILAECEDDAVFKSVICTMVETWCDKKGYSITEVLEEILLAGRLIEAVSKSESK